MRHCSVRVANMDGEDYDPRGALDAGADSGVPYGTLLTAFVEAALGADAERLAQTREALGAAIGAAGLVDAAAAVASFNAVVKVADGTGIALEEAKAARSRRAAPDLGTRRTEGGLIGTDDGLFLWGGAARDHCGQARGLRALECRRQRPAPGRRGDRRRAWRHRRRGRGLRPADPAGQFAAPSQRPVCTPRRPPGRRRDQGPGRSA